MRPQPEGVNELCSVGRIILQTCRTAAEGLEVARKMNTRNAIIIGDAGGDLVLFQGVGPFQAHRHVEEDLVFTSNHVVMPELWEALDRAPC